MPKKLEPDELYEARAGVMKALASPTRLKIIDLLAEGENAAEDVRASWHALTANARSSSGLRFCMG